jgi:uncharacterized protein YkwD
MSKKFLFPVVFAVLAVAVAPITVDSFGVPAAEAASVTAVSQYDADVATILASTNKVRADAGLPALKLNAQMSAVALDGAKSQAASKVLASNPNASAQIPAGWSSFGQAVSFGRTPATVTEGFMASTNPRAHLLSVSHTDTGIGIAYTSTGTPYYTQLFAGYKAASDEVSVSVPQSVTTSALGLNAFTVVWGKPATVVGSVKNYTVTVTSGSVVKTFTTTGLSQSVSGLNQNTAYTVKVTANAVSVSGKNTKSASHTTTITTTRTLTQADLDRIVADTNVYRAAVGLAPVKQDTRLNKVASDWTKVMAAENRRYHNDNLGAQLPAGWSADGENIANGQTVTTVVKAWYDSPSHRANMLNPRFNTIGVGIAYNSNGQLFFTQDFAEYK